MDLGRAGPEEQLYQLAARVAADYRVVHHDNPLALYHGRQRVELQPDAELAHPVRRLDKRPPHVAVLYEPFGVGDAAALRVADRRHHPRVGDGDDHVGLDRGLLSQELAHAVAGPRDLPPVEAGVRAGEVHVLEDAKGAARALGPVARQAPIVYHDHFAWLHVAQEPRPDNVEPAGLAGDGVAALDLAYRERPEAVRVAESDQLVAEDHGHRVGPFEPAHSLSHRLAYRMPPLQLAHSRRGDVRGVRGRVEPEAIPLELLAQGPGVDEVPVMGHRHVHVAPASELGLGVLPGSGAGSRVADVAEGEVPVLEGGQTRAVEDLRDEAHVPKGGSPFAVGDRDPCRLLAPVLQGVEPEVRALGQLSRELPRVEAEDAAGLLRLAVGVAVILVQKTHLSPLRSCPTRPRSSRPSRCRYSAWKPARRAARRPPPRQQACARPRAAPL